MTMELRRTLLIVAMAVVGYFLLINWQKDYGNLATPTPATSSAATVAASDVPTAPATTAATASDVPAAPSATPSAVSVPSAKATIVSVKTDVLDTQIDLTGGDLVQVALPAYTEKVDSKKPFLLLENSSNRVFVAQSGLIGTDGPDAQASGRPRYESTASSYTLKDGEKSLQVVLSLPANNGVTIHKVYEFTRGEYLVKVRYEITNAGTTPWKGLTGASMALNDLGEVAGSVTGGCVEPAVIREALEAIRDGKARLLEYGVSHDRAWEVGLACGGTIEVYVERLAP